MSNPPSVERIGSTDDLKSMVEQINDEMVRLSNYLTTIAAAAHPDMVELLASYGLDRPGRFGFMATTGEKAAGEFHKMLQRAADQAIAAAKVMDGAYVFWLKNVKQPVEAAEAARSKSGPRIKV